jgi:hypothetical protein
MMKTRLRCRWFLGIATPGLAWVLLAQLSSAQSLPQLDQRIEIDAPTAAKLTGALSVSGAGASTLSPDIEALLVKLLPASLKDSCKEMMELDGPGRDQAIWHARPLYVNGRGGAYRAVIAYRCAFRPNPHFSPFFDERPALLSLGAGAATLVIIPVDKPCDHCSDLYSTDFAKPHANSHGELTELQVTSTPVGDGPDSFTRTQSVWVDEAQGRVVLRVDSRTESDTYDDETEKGSQSVCDAKMGYERDATGDLSAIVTVTTCTEDNVVKPSETVRYVWDPKAKVFSRGLSQGGTQASVKH